MTEAENHVLLVDGNQTNLDMLSKRLLRAGYQVSSATSSHSALSILAKENIDVVLIDILMPEIDGLEVLRRIRLNHDSTTLPVIILSARMESDLVGESLELGANDYITKPVDFKILKARLKTQLQLKESFLYRLSLAEQLNADTKERLNFIYNSASECIITVTEQGLIESFNHAAENAFGYRAADIVGKEMRQLLPNPNRYKSSADFIAYTNDNIGDITNKSHEILAQHKNGTVFPVEISVSALAIADSTLYSCIIRDISERKKQEKVIFNLAYVDSLTGLDNRNQFFISAKNMIEEAAANKHRLAALMLDLDNFKEINDSFGHSTGDQVLAVLGTRLKHCVSEKDTVARLGGDEFAIFLSHESATFTEIDQLINRIIQRTEEPIYVNEHVHNVEISIGISRFPRDGSTIESLLRKADIALYKAKKLKRSAFRFYEEKMDEETWNNKRRLDALRDSIKDECSEFYMLYQPIFDMRQRAFHSVEGLLRWQSSSLGFVSPAEFIPLAEETGLIIPLGTWVLYECCRQAHQWEQQGMPLQVSINVSAVQFAQSDFVEIVEDAIYQSQVNPELIQLEITEGMVMDEIGKVIFKLQQLRDLGITLAMDDFGTGYSSLSYLRRLAVQSLKVDRSFIMNTPDNIDDSSITEAIILMAQTLGKSVIAEGVETDAQVHMLADMNCDAIQGFYFSKPITAKEVEQFLASHSADVINKLLN